MLSNLTLTVILLGFDSSDSVSGRCVLSNLTITVLLLGFDSSEWVLRDQSAIHSQLSCLGGRQSLSDRSSWDVDGCCVLSQPHTHSYTAWEVGHGFRSAVDRECVLRAQPTSYSHLYCL